MFMGLVVVHPQILRELASVMTRPLSIISERSWGSGYFPEDQNTTNVIPFFRKAWFSVLPWNYEPVSLMSLSTWQS